jgi:adenylyltransferase/sulfurtransferase
VGSLEVALALRFLVGQLGAADVGLLSLDVWTQSFRRVSMPESLAAECPLCRDGRYDYLVTDSVRAVTLCGRNAVQIIPGSRSTIDLEALAGTLASFGTVDVNEFLLRCASPPYELTLFSDGRAIVRGTEEPGVAKSVYSRLVGM